MKHIVFRLLCVLALMIVPLFGVRAEQPFTLATATDLHLIAPELTDKGAYFTAMIEAADGKMTHYSDEITDAWVAQVISEQPDAVVLTGDLTFNGARKSHEACAEKLRRFTDAGIPVYVLPGNHDLNSKSAASFSGEGYTLVSSVSASEFARIYHDFGFAQAISRDTRSLSYIAQLRPGLLLLMLDVNTMESPGSVHPDTLAWLHTQLRQAQAAGHQSIAASHQNLYAHSTLLSRGYIIANASSLQSAYAQYGVLLNLSGHIHMQHTVSGDGLVPEAATSSLSVSPCQYGMITLTAEACNYETRMVDVSAWAKRSALSNPDLLDFGRYADTFFRGSSLRQTPDDEDAKKLADSVAEINAAYFAGRLDAIPADSRQLVQQSALPGFLGAYMSSILEEGPVNHTRLSFPIHP